MKADEVPDWRIRVAFKVDKVTGLNPPGRPGDILLHMTETKVSNLGTVSFPIVSSYRLALSIAIKAAPRATALWSRVKWGPPQKKPRFIDMTTLGLLYEYFEECMTAATFSFQSLESYANEVIAIHLKEGQTVALARKKEEVTYDAVALQRFVSTGEKLSVVVPRLLNCPPLKETKVWQKFVILKQVRDSIVHLKSEDHFVRGSVDKESLSYRLMLNSPGSYPQTAMEVMRHFEPGDEVTSLDHAEAQLRGD